MNQVLLSELGCFALCMCVCVFKMCVFIYRLNEKQPRQPADVDQMLIQRG